MRLSEWRAASPNKEAASAKIAAIVDPILVALGAGPDPTCWVAWGEEPGVRYTILVPTPAGLITCYVRVNVPGEGPRASAKLNRWSRVQVGELAVESQGTHRLLSFQVDQQVLNGADDRADEVAAFALALFAAIDGRPAPPELKARSTRSARSASPAKSSSTTRARPGATGVTGASKRASGSGR
jgi:hypothetical protein